MTYLTNSGLRLSIHMLYKGQCVIKTRQPSDRNPHKKDPQYFCTIAKIT